MLRVRLLGDLEIESDGGAIEPPSSRRARALLGWLALERRLHTRSALAARFWPDVLDESARTSLRSALSAVRRSLGPDSERYLIAGRNDVGLAGDSEVWTDVAEFARRVEQDRLEEALELCRGELLAGLDDDWVYERRDEHRDNVAAVLARLAARAEDEQRWQAAIEYTRRQAGLDPLAEEPHRDLMRRLTATGDLAAAIRTYERLSRRLREELRIGPSRATRELAEALRQRGASAPGDPQIITEEAPAVVTLLFTDLVGSTALLDELGDDEAERLRRVHFGLLRDVATAHEGHEVKNLGDGLMVAFASAVNAIRCAISIQQAVARHNARRADDRLRVRVGLNVGEPIRDEDDYFGTPVVVAKRLCDAAAGDQILASGLVRGLVGSRGGFAFRPLGARALKGISGALETWEVVWEAMPARRIALPLGLRADDSAPLIGRETQLAELRGRWQEARAGRQGVVVLAGEPGIGKTRLAAEFCCRAYAEGAVVLLGRCHEDSLAPYQPVVEALRHYVSETPLDQLRLQIGAHRAPLATLLPELGDSGAQSASPSAPAPEREQFVLFDAVASLLRAAAEERPLILALDDLHWADATTLALLRHVLRATERAPLLVVATYRETEIDQAHPLAPVLAELRRARVLTSLVLAGLDTAEVAMLIASRAGRSAPAAFARSIADRTEGNPFFVEELLRDVRVSDDWDAALARIEVPQSVKDVLLRRLRRLEDSCRRLLTIAAVAGREFSLEVIERVAGVDAEEVAESLEHAIAAHIVDEAASLGRYSFAHGLIRETIYEQLSRTRRAQLHRLVGEAMESDVGPTPDRLASELAYHFSAAGDAAKAYEYHALAAAGAQRVFAVQPALVHYTAALKAGAALGLGADRDPALRRLLLQRGSLRWRTGEAGDAATDLNAALDAARQAGDRAIEVDVLNELGIMQLRSNRDAAAACHESALAIARELGDEAGQTFALDRLAVICAHGLQFDRALALGERALELARATADPVVVGRALDSLKLGVWQLGDIDRLEELTATLEPLWRERGDLWYLQFTLLEAAFVPIARARWDDATERLAEAVAVNRRVGDPLGEMLILDALCWLNRSRGAYDEALTAGRRAIARCADIGWEGWAAATLGWTLLELGAAPAAAEVLEPALVAGERTGAPSEIARCAGELAWARLLLDDRDGARALAARAEGLLGAVTAPPGGAFLFGAHAYAAVARVLLATGAPDRGEALLRPVRDAAARAGWWEAAAMTELVLGLCLEERGERDRGLAALAHAAALADEHALPATGWEAHAALARLDDDPLNHLRAAEAIVERIAAGLTDEALRTGLRTVARA